MSWAVKLPNPEREDYEPFIMVRFDTKEEAVKWSKECFNSNEEGWIKTVYQIEEDER